MKFKVELLQTSLNKLNILCGHYLDQLREKFQQSSHLHEFKIFEVNHTEVAGCFGEQAQIEQKMNKIIFALRFSLWACLFAQNVFHENELSL